MSQDKYREEFEEHVGKYLRICSKGSRMAKLATNRAFDLDFKDYYEEYIQLQAVAMTSADFNEAAAAYREKREPQWE